MRSIHRADDCERIVAEEKAVTDKLEAQSAD
jgi:hypothetical protein